MKKGVLFILLSCALFSSCERDDICAATTPITPLLVIDFFDAENPSEPKVPNGLFIAEEGSNIGLAFTSASISLPLRTDVDQTRYNFFLNFGEEGDTPENVDQLVFNYLRQEEFVSKACGFRVTYQGLQDEFIPLADNAWIANITILDATIEDETEAHIRIFH